jgi:hypothetical protein
MTLGAEDFKSNVFTSIINYYYYPSCFYHFAAVLFTSDDTRFPNGVHIGPCRIYGDKFVWTFKAELSLILAGIKASELEITSIACFYTNIITSTVTLP